MPKTKEEMVKCHQNRRQCFAYRNGKCDCLNDTKFRKLCPFFKDRQQVMMNGDTVRKLWELKK